MVWGAVWLFLLGVQLMNACPGPIETKCHLCEPPCRLITSITTNSSDDCCSLCNSVKTCQFWTLNLEESLCHLKQDQSPISAGNSCTSGTATAFEAASIVVDPSVKLHPTQRGLHGCHIDLGYDHQAYGFTTELLYGESFETFNLPGPAPSLADSQRVDSTVKSIQGIAPSDNTTLYWYQVLGAASQVTLTQDAPFNGLQSVRLSRSQGMSPVSIVNRGFHGQGLALSANHQYHGSLYARNQGSQAVTLNISLEDFHVGLILSTLTVQVPAGSDWAKYSFDLPTRHSTSCQDYPWDTAPLFCYGGLQYRAGHACWQCGGQLAVQLASVGQVDLDAASFEDVEVRFEDQRVTKEIVNLLQAIDLDGIRLGGTYVKLDTALDNASHIGYYWKALRGDADKRPPIVQQGSGISPFWGSQLRSAVFGPMEILNLTEKLNITGIITLNHLETDDDLADLVDYMFSDDGSNPWVQQRGDDGHPDPFNLDKYFELGNEIYNFNFVSQVDAMEKRATALGVGGKLRYACPWQCQTKILDDGASKYGSQIYLDRHDSDDPQADVFEQLIAQWEKKDYTARFTIWETNTGTLHDFQRVMQEAQDMNQYEREAQRVRLDSRTASFCVEASGHDDLWANGHGDQGLIFFAPNQTWAQPPYYLHKMVVESRQDYVVAANSSLPQLDVVALASNDGNNIAVRVLNYNNISIAYKLDLETTNTACLLTSSTYAAPNGQLNATNPAVDPYRYVPTVKTGQHVQVRDGWNNTAQPYEFATLVFEC
eukprot:m.223846 g.223846  ORF g.223846 m.223846 type:complete len:768 (-) comp17274_c0_seq5:1144-3447(-)